MTTSKGAAKPRLLVLASTYPRWLGDPEPGFIHELAKRLADDFDVTVVGPHAPGSVHSEILEGVRVHRYRYAPAAMETLVNDGGIVTNLKRQPWKWVLVPGFVLGLMWSLLRLNRKWRPDVIHAHWLLPQGLIVAAFRKLGIALPPFLVTSHGADLFALRARPLPALKRFVIRHASAVTVVSDAMRDELARIGADAADVSVQPMGVDLTGRFIPDQATERSSNEILFVGRLVEKKGLRHLIDAMPAILQVHPGAFLTVAGFGPEEAALRAQVLRLSLEDRVRFRGAVRQADLPALYRRAAVFVAPFAVATSGDQEGLGLVAVEAAGCGCPVILSAMAQTRGVFDRDSVIWAKSGDADSLATACIDLLSNPEAAKLRAANARSSVFERFDWAGRASAYRDRLITVIRTSAAHG